MEDANLFSDSGPENSKRIVRHPRPGSRARADLVEVDGHLLLEHAQELPGPATRRLVWYNGD
jgi:hypothetical protein